MMHFQSIGKRGPQRGVVAWMRWGACWKIALCLFFASFACFANGQAVTSEPTEATERIPTTSRGVTLVRPPEVLVSLVQRGGVPKDLQQLQALETQQREIAKRAALCTVNVQLESNDVGSTQGGGVIITGDGYVLTAAHVAERPGKRVKIVLGDGRIVSARTLGMNRGVDAGLIKIDSGQNDGEPWQHASVGSSKPLTAGMWCMATGHPGGFDQQRGVVVRVGRILAVRPGSIVTDCALIGGDSGGPLFDLSGRLIAIHSRIGNDVADNLHVPVHHYKNDWDDLAAGKAWGFLPGFRPILGVRGVPASPLAVVESVHPGSPADIAGIRKGDIIEMLGDDTISDFESLKRAVEENMPGKRVVVRLKRDGEIKRLVVEIGRDPRFEE